VDTKHFREKTKGQMPTREPGKLNGEKTERLSCERKKGETENSKAGTWDGVFLKTPRHGVELNSQGESESKASEWEEGGLNWVKEKRRNMSFWQKNKNTRKNDFPR